MSSIRSSVDAAFDAAFRPNPLLADYFTGRVIKRWRSFTEPVFDSLKEEIRGELNDILKDWKISTPVGDPNTGETARFAAKRALRGLFVLLAFVQHLESESPLILSLDQFLAKYPECVGVRDDALLPFRNFMAVALTVEEAENNKGVLIEICTRLSEGFDAKYITGGGTGSGPKTATSRRVLIFETESDTEPKPRELRGVKDTNSVSTTSTTTSKRSRASTTSDGSSKKARTESISDDSSISSEVSSVRPAEVVYDGVEPVLGTNAPPAHPAFYAGLMERSADLCEDFSDVNLRESFPCHENEAALWASVLRSTKCGF